MDYDERLGVPLRWWVQGTMLVLSVWIATIVALPEPAAWAATAVALALMVFFFLAYGGVRLRLHQGEFHAGAAHIPLPLLGAATPLDQAATRRQAGPDADARAYLLLRPYLKRSVRVEVADPADPTPYWLVSSRRPAALAAALNEATGRLADTAPPTGSAQED